MYAGKTKKRLKPDAVPTLLLSEVENNQREENQDVSAAANNATGTEI